jgi:hypothetical protein
MKGKKKEKGRGKEQNNRKENRKKKKRQEKGIMDISPYYPHYTVRRSCFAKRFSKVVSHLKLPQLVHLICLEYIIGLGQQCQHAVASRHHPPHCRPKVIAYLL